MMVVGSRGGPVVRIAGAPRFCCHPLPTVRRWLRRAPQKHAHWLYAQAVKHAFRLNHDMLFRPKQWPSLLCWSLNILAGVPRPTTTWRAQTCRCGPSSDTSHEITCPAHPCAPKREGTVLCHDLKHPST